jgi:hypothetical protein
MVSARSSIWTLRDRDQKFCREFREALAAGGVKCRLGGLLKYYSRAA